VAGKNVLWLRSIPSTKPDIRRSRPPIQKRIIAAVRLFTQPGPLPDIELCEDLAMAI